jgi:hypothetical protein
VGYHEVIYGGIVVKIIEFCRCMIVLAAVAAFALCASAAGAQTVSAADREALAGPWVGRWDSDTHEYGATMSLTIGADGSVEGKIDWTLRSSNRPDYKSKVGLKGIEYVRGTFLSSASVLSIDRIGWTTRTRSWEPTSIVSFYRKIAEPLAGLPGTTVPGAGASF